MQHAAPVAQPRLVALSHAVTVPVQLAGFRTHVTSAPVQQVASGPIPDAHIGE
jgi:hypothetical protein